MRELSAATVVALHALHLMMRKRKPVTTEEIHESCGFRVDLIREIVGKLRRHGLIQNSSNHGYVLSRAPGEISIRHVMEAVDEPVPPTAPCGGTFDACLTRASCILSPLCRNAEEAYQASLRSFTLAELMDVPLDVPNCMDPRSKVGAS